MRYSANVRGNHVALVDIARAGPEARVRMDGSFNAELASENHEVNMVKVRIDGLEYDANEQLAAAIAKQDVERAEAQKRAAATRADLEKQTARADAAEKALAEAPGKVLLRGSPRALPRREGPQGYGHRDEV